MPLSWLPAGTVCPRKQVPEHPKTGFNALIPFRQIINLLPGLHPLQALMWLSSLLDITERQKNADKDLQRAFSWALMSRPLVHFPGSGVTVVSGTLLVPLLGWHQGHWEQMGLGGTCVSSSPSGSNWPLVLKKKKKAEKKQQEGLLL